MNIRSILYWLLISTLLQFVGSGCSVTPVDPAAPRSTAIQQPGDDIAGTYRLVAVNGIRIPGEIEHDGAKLGVESGIFRIAADGRISSETVFTPPDGRPMTRRVEATYTRDGSSLVMRWEGAGVTRGTLDGEIFVMNNHGMILVYSRSGQVDSSLDLATLGRCDAEPVSAAAGVFDDFNGELTRGADCYGNSLGYFTFRDSPQTRVDISTTSEHPRRPGEKAGNRVLEMDLDVRAWAGVIHSFENASVDSWTARDWSAFDALGFWIYGSNSGTNLYIDILDNRKPGSTRDDAERFTLAFNDNFSGWRKLVVPFRHMVRKNIGNQAPNDYLNLTAVHGWALGTTRTDRPLTLYLDDFELLQTRQGMAATGQGRAITLYPINETPMYGNRRKTPAQRQADDSYVEYMLERYSSRADAARAAAEQGWKLYREGDPRTAIKRFNQAWLLDPRDQHALWGFAAISADRGNIEDAIRYYRMAIDYGPPNPDLQQDYEGALRRLES